jgi:hypothetical protein
MPYIFQEHQLPWPLQSQQLVGVSSMPRINPYELRTSKHISFLQLCRFRWISDRSRLAQGHGDLGG